MGFTILGILGFCTLQFSRHSESHTLSFSASPTLFVDDDHRSAARHRLAVQASTSLRHSAFNQPSAIAAHPPSHSSPPSLPTFHRSADRPSLSFLRQPIAAL
ncbi:hypothetical protein L2E82_08244 [Cichorium intybus]|uniref:Uncharacterized protein n=1 Tax=Cichorium intybus TaxID=13427 RepID=A0ACB9G7X1_CICIN|nr:hypothetical protein L2E82_08244 [Cichorium intybus]